MPQCAFHPGTETNVRCVECDRYICPKDFVPTPVGYKCKECAKPLPSARRTVKPRQLLLAALAAAGVGIGGAFLLAFAGFYSWLGAILLGIATGEAARRASGGHRTGQIAAVAGIMAVVGTRLTYMSLLSTIIAAGVAVFFVTSNRW